MTKNLPICVDPDFLAGHAIIAGAEVHAARRIAVVHPATSKVIANIPDLDGEDAERAMQANFDSLLGWRAQSGGASRINAGDELK